MKELIYLDNATTSFPKPKVVLEGIQKCFFHSYGSPYRTSSPIDRLLDETRSRLAALFHIDHPEHLSFTYNATHALNILIKGILKNEDHVIISNLEHNSVLRPLFKLSLEKDISFDMIYSNLEGLFDLDELKKKIRKNTRLIIWNHASNVTGIISPIHAIGKIAKKYGVAFLVDCTQSAGILDINVQNDQIDFLAGTGHKALLAPPGIGFLYAKDPSMIDTLYEGGSGYLSSSMHQPSFPPFKFEAGTSNYFGIAGLLESLKFLSEFGEEIRSRKRALLKLLTEELLNIQGISIYGSLDLAKRVPIISLNLQGYLPQEIYDILEKKYSIITRAGLHCAPFVHKTFGSYPNGSLRISIGYSNTMEEIHYLIRVLNYLKNKL